MPENSKESKKSIHRFRNGKIIQNILKEMKKAYREKEGKELKDKISTLIPLFVLEVGHLEFWIKEFYAKDLKTEKEYNDYFYHKTLGRAIDYFEGCTKFKDSKDFQIQGFSTPKCFFTPKYKDSFINACREVNNLRNDLYHNLFLKYQGLESLLEKIEPRIEFYDVVYMLRCENLRANSCRSLPQGEQLSDNWTIEMLYEILRRYYDPNKL